MRVIVDELRKNCYYSYYTGLLSKDNSLPKQTQFKIKQEHDKYYNKYIFYKELLNA